MKAQMSLELLFALLALLVCVGFFLGAIGESGSGIYGEMQYWGEKEMLSEQAMLAQEFAGAGRNVIVELHWEEWRANGNLLASVRSNASARGVARVYSDATGRRIAENGLEGV